MPTDCVSRQQTQHWSLIRYIQEKVRLLQEPVRIILIMLLLSLPGLCFASGILDGKSKDRLVEYRCHCLVVTLVKGIT